MLRAASGVEGTVPPCVTRQCDPCQERIEDAMVMEAEGQGGDGHEPSYLLGML